MAEHLLGMCETLGSIHNSEEREVGEGNSLSPYRIHSNYQKIIFYSHQNPLFRNLVVIVVTLSYEFTVPSHSASRNSS